MTNKKVPTQSNAIGIDYNDAQLRVLVAEYIIRQRGTFTLQGVCNYILFWAMEEGHTITDGTALYESNQLAPADCERISAVLVKIVKEGRILVDGERFEYVV